MPASIRVFAVSDPSSCFGLGAGGQFQPDGREASACVSEAEQQRLSRAARTLTAAERHLHRPGRPLVSRANGVGRKFTAAFKSAITLGGVMGPCGRSRGGRERSEVLLLSEHRQKPWNAKC